MNWNERKAVVNDLLDNSLRELSRRAKDEPQDMPASLFNEINKMLALWERCFEQKAEEETLDKAEDILDRVPFPSSN